MNLVQACYFVQFCGGILTYFVQFWQTKTTTFVQFVKKIVSLQSKKTTSIRPKKCGFCLFGRPKKCSFASKVRPKKCKK